MKSDPSTWEPLAITLSVEARSSLEQLRLRLLDKRGKKPTPSEVIEGLIKAAIE
jgi:hypothetical protein